MITGIVLEDLVVLDQRAGLVAVEPRHHDVHEDDVGLVVGDLGEGIEAVHGREHLAALLRQQGLGGAADGLAVVDDETLRPSSLDWAAVSNLHSLTRIQAGRALRYRTQ
jgi:hypothetical protein